MQADGSLLVICMQFYMSSVCSSQKNNLWFTSLRYEFAGFCIDQDKEKLSRCNMYIPNFADIQANWRVPEATKTLDSLGDVSAIIIDDYYAHMKRKMTDQEHNQWTWVLSRRHIEYAAKDAYTAFEIWNRITTV